MTASKGLMQTIPATYRTVYDPLANMTASVEYARSMTEESPWISREEYEGIWATDIEIRPRQGGKSTFIERARVISETVKPRPEMEEIMERAMTHGYADGGVISSPTGRLGVPVRLSPGEHVLTAETARAVAGDILSRMGWPPATAELEAELDAVEDPPDDYPEPPQLPVW